MHIYTYIDLSRAISTGKNLQYTLPLYMRGCYFLRATIRAQADMGSTTLDTWDSLTPDKTSIFQHIISAKTVTLNANGTLENTPGMKAEAPNNSVQNYTPYIIQGRITVRVRPTDAATCDMSIVCGLPEADLKAGFDLAALFPDWNVRTYAHGRPLGNSISDVGVTNAS